MLLLLVLLFITRICRYYYIFLGLFIIRMLDDSFMYFLYILGRNKRLPDEGAKGLVAEEGRHICSPPWERTGRQTCQTTPSRFYMAQFEKLSR